nr:hypothetical protein [uncultured Steroidobacter sp.]
MRKKSIPLAHLFKGEGFRRNFDLLEKEPNRDERLVAALKDEMLRLARETLVHKEIQARKARKPRGKGDDGRTMRDVVADLARGHVGDTPRDLWTHLGSAIESWAGECEEVDGPPPAYRYPSASGRIKTLTYKHYCDLLRQARKNLKKPD